MVGVSGTSRADQARLRSYEFEVSLVAEPTGLTDREHALVDLAGSGVGVKKCRNRQVIITGWL
jgi:hypothetical protein